MGGKSRKSGGVSRALINRIKQKGTPHGKSITDKKAGGLLGGSESKRNNS